MHVVAGVKTVVRATAEGSVEDVVFVDMMLLKLLMSFKVDLSRHNPVETCDCQRREDRSKSCGDQAKEMGAYNLRGTQNPDSALHELL